MGNWRKSSYSDGNGGSCVETADGDGAVLVRDTTDRGGLTLSVPAPAWLSFINGVRASR
ncbi:MAG TPA: DUF397 domain-containing protein [Trebonia sp.]